MPYIVNMRVVAQYRKDIYIVRAQIERTHNIDCRVLRVDEASVRQIERAGYGEPERMGMGWESLPAYWVAHIYAVTSKEGELIDVVGDMIEDKRVLGKTVPYYIEEKWCEDEKTLTGRSELDRELEKRGFAMLSGRLIRHVSREDKAHAADKKIRRARMNYVSPRTREAVNQMFRSEKRRAK